jgi:hypothetical protein
MKSVFELQDRNNCQIRYITDIHVKEQEISQQEKPIIL